MKKSIVIPIKTNNQRLPGKNTMILGDKPLHNHLFDTLRDVKEIDIYVDSSDENILDISESYGFKTIKRPTRLNGPDTSGNDLIEHALEKIECDLFGQFFVTTPFLKKETILKSFDIFNHFNVTSCFGVYPVHDRFWYNGEPVNHNFKSLVGTQYMEPLMRESGFYVFKKEAFLKQRSRITENFKTFVVDENECIDIDTREDFIYAESIYKSGVLK